MKGKSFVLLPLCLLLVCSCGSYHRLAYLQDMKVDYDYQVAPKPDTRICPDDKVRIVVTCSSPELAAPFNVVTGMVNYDAASRAVRENAADLEEKGYLVDQNGDINFPVLGKLHVADLTLGELKALGEAGVDIIPAGMIPPNPVELLKRERLDEMMKVLRGMYDYILIDSVPVDIVADPVIINRVVDTTVFVVRSGMIDKRMLPMIDDLYDSGRLNNMCIVLNGSTVRRHYGGNYGYGYGYGYGVKEEENK